MTSHLQDGDRTVFDYAETVYRRRGTAALVAAAVFGAFALYAFGSAPVYRASATLDVEKPAEPFPAGGGAYIPPEEDYLPTQAKLIASDTALRRVYEELRLGETREFLRGVPALREAVSVLPVPRTRLCTIAAESRDPQRAAAIVQALADLYLKRNLENQTFMPRKVLAELDARGRRRDARRFYESLPAVAANPEVVDLGEQLARARAETAKLRAVFKDDHPLVVAAHNQIAQLQASRDAAVDRAVAGFRTGLAALRPNNARLVDPAEAPDRPVRPRKRLALLLGLLGGGLLGVLSALCLETLDQTVRTHGDMERGLGLPVLGHIPLARRKKGERVYAPLVRADPSSQGEAFRTLRTMVVFAKASDPDPFLLVTSAVQEEGKSFVAANLAVALAQLGRKVLLIDGDLRRPSQHLLLGAAAKRGLADVLSGRAADPGQAVVKGEVPNLEVLQGGARPSNPSELLSGEQLASLAAWARERYDRVVVDCPPVFPVGDVLLWGRHARSTILVSRAGRTRVPVVEMACSRLRAGGMDILGGVINGTRRSTLPFADGRDFDRYCRGPAQEPPPGEPS
jgi:tyrosine-protein kinase Etk/Wzc